MEEFKKAAYTKGQRTSFNDFKQHYKILGAGENIQRAGIENFTYNLTEEGYNKMLDFIDSELK